MGVQKTELEVTSTVPAQKLYKGLLLDIDTILPKAFPEAIKCTEILEGDGGVGTVKLVTLGEASQYNTMKQRIDAIDKHALTYTYSIIGGDILLDKVESIVNHFTVCPTPDGGSITKNTTIFNTKGDAVLPEEIIKDATEKAGLIFKAVEAYLLAN